MRRRCLAVNAQGQPCRAAPLRDGERCRMHAPEFAAEVADARKLGGIRRRREVTLGGAYDFDGLNSPADVVRLTEIAIMDVLSLDNAAMRSRLLLQAVRIANNVIETTTVAEDIDVLTETVRARRVRGRPAQGART